MADDLVHDVDLTPVEQRVVGSLLEKQVTVPASYPMTLNGLRTACNQSSSRDPITDLDESAILAAIADLKTRTERLHGFEDRADAEACLERLAARDAPLVRELERQPGQHDTRWIHLLGPVDLTTTARSGTGGGPPPVDREVVLADGPVARDSRVVAVYDQVATAYADTLIDELDGKPFDRWLLERLADLAAGGPVAEAGCGPGQVAFHLATAGADVTGFDLAPAMVAEARRRFPELRFEQADLTDLPPPDGGDDAGWAAIAAWYSLVHLAGSELRPAIALLARTLRPGGWLAVAVHVGDEVRHLDEWFDQEVELDFVLHDREAVLDAFRTAGLVDVEWYVRGPNGSEAATDRLYVLARRAAA